MEALPLIAIAVLILGSGLLSEHLRGSMVTTPMLFVLFGMAIGSYGLGWVDWHVHHPDVHAIVELTLILVLFSEASRCRSLHLRQQGSRVPRMLIIGLPVSVALGGLFAAWIFEALDLWQALLLAAVLAPTDAALGEAIFSNPKVPEKTRQTLEVESGMNDGVMLPIVILLLVCQSLASPGEFANFWHFWIVYLLKQLGFGCLIGAVVGFGGARLMGWVSRVNVMTPTFQALSGVAIALLAYGCALLGEGNGFVAAFVAGLVVGNSGQNIAQPFYAFTRAHAELLTMLTFMTFGAAVALQALSALTWPILIYALLSLLVVRLVAVVVSLLGSGLRWEETFILAWFGPRGVATLLFGIIVLESQQILERDFIFQVAAVTVLLSIFIHGLSAQPLARWFARRLEM